MKVKAQKVSDAKKIDEFNDFACSHKFYSPSTGLVDQPFFIRVGDQVTINPKCEASYADLLRAWALQK